MKKRMLSVIALGVLGGLFLAGNSWSQQPATEKSPLFRLPSSVAPKAATEPYAVPYEARHLLERSEIEQLMTQLREADDDAKKADLTKKLEAAIVTNFDKDMTSRETELTKLEERLTKLRAQLDRRRKAKPEIIQLQIKVMVNEADGLGFSGASVNKLGLPVKLWDSTTNGVLKKIPIRLESPPGLPETVPERN